MSTARWIDTVLGVVFVLLGIWGLLTPGAPVLGIFPVNTALGVIAILAGGVLLFGAANTTTAKSTAGVVGVLFAVAGIAGLFSQSLFGLIPESGWTVTLFILAAALLLYDWLGAPDEATDGRSPVR